MIVSPRIYVRDVLHTQTNNALRIQAEKQFLVGEALCHLRNRNASVFKYLNTIEPEIEKVFHQSSLVSVEATEHRSPNTIVTLDLGTKYHLHDQYKLKYDRLPVSQYFNASQLIEQNKSDSFLNIYYDQWLRYQDTPEDFRRFISRTFTYKLGRTFAQDGIVIVDDGKTDNIIGESGLALIVPSPESIQDGWAYMKHLENHQRGTLTEQVMSVGLRLVASNHLAIADGEIVFKIQLRRPLESYKDMTGEA